MSDGGKQFQKLFLGSSFAGFTLDFFEAGTSTGKDVYLDEAGTTATRQIAADARGMAIWYADGDYRVRIKDSDGILLWDWPAWKMTSATATEWEGDNGLAYPAAESINRWQFFAKHTAGNLFEEMGINEGSAFRTLFTKYTDSPPYRDVRIDGAVAGDATDDSFEIQANIAALSNGGITLLPLGIWDISTKINLKQGTHGLQGMGVDNAVPPLDGTVIKKGADGMTHGIHITGINWSLKDFALDCNGKDGNGLYFNTTNYGRLENVQVSEVGGTGVGAYFDTCSLNEVHQLFIRNCYDGVKIVGTNGSNFYGTFIWVEDDTYNNGLVISNVSHTDFFGLFLDGCGINASGNCHTINIYGLYAENAFNLGKATILLENAVGFFGFNIYGGYMIHTNASNTQYFIEISNGCRGTNINGLVILRDLGLTNTMIYVGAPAETTITSVTSAESVAYKFLTSHALATGIKIDGHVAKGAGEAEIELGGSKHSVKNCINTKVSLLANCSDTVIENVDGAITVGASNSNIVIINCPGAITIDSTASRVVLILCTGTLTDTANIAIRDYTSANITSLQDTITGSTGMSIVTLITHVDSTTGAAAYTLADGKNGQKKYIVMSADGGDGTLTPANLGNGTTITFNDIGDSADLIFTNGLWHMIGGTATLA